ncbi:MAG TPA: amidohydrolase family protein [Bacteroidales bacterium]|nr:amidohydrolase family protein [Bacteroidales bacterium]
MKKLSAHYIFDGICLRKNAILEIEDSGKIVGLSEERKNIAEAENLSFYNGILLPGIINSHQHLELAWMKNRIAGSKGMAGFLNSVAELRKSTPEEPTISEEMRTLDRIMYSQGITAAIDVSNNAESIGVKKDSNIEYFTTVELYGLDSCRNDEIVRKGEEIVGQFRSKSLNASLTPHSFYLTNTELLKIISCIGNNMVSIHFFESNEEACFNVGNDNELSLFLRSFYPPFAIPENYSEIIVKTISKIIKTNKLILVHNTFIPEFLLKSLMALDNTENLFFCLCPKSNRYITERLPDLNKFISHGCKLLLGTDSPASNPDFNFASELFEIQQNYPSVSIAEMLQWCTSNPAEIFCCKGNMGSFITGTSPGIVLLENAYLPNLSLTSSSIFRRLF